MKQDSIAIMIKAASVEFDKLSNQILADYNLTHSQFKVLKFILREPELTVRQIDIEKFFYMTNPSVTGLLHNLEKKQMIERIPNPQDHRSKVIRLTEKVYEMEEQLSQIGNTLEERFTQNLNREEKEQLRSLLRKMLGNCVN